MSDPISDPKTTDKTHAPGKPQTPANEWQRLIFATHNSLKGYRRVFKDEAAFRAQLVVLLILLPIATVWARSFLEWMLLIGVWVLVLAGELMNSAIEAAIDRIGLERHNLSAKAKDAGSALTLTLMMLAFFVWVAVALDRYVLGL